MNILVSNDDGIEAKGLHVLVDALSRVPGNQVYVAAPDGQRSACGHGISMFEMLKIDERQVPGAVWARAVSGTPADSVKFGMKYLAREENVRIDVVFSGINHGGNIGSDVHYSGTVSAAAEGLLCGVPAVAVSLGTHQQKGGSRTGENDAPQCKFSAGSSCGNQRAAGDEAGAPGVRRAFRSA